MVINYLKTPTQFLKKILETNNLDGKKMKQSGYHSYLYKMSLESSDNQNSNPIVPLGLCICSIVVLANTTSEDFESLDMKEYYNFLLFTLIALAYLFVSICAGGCGMFLCIDNVRAPAILNVIMIVSSVLILLCTYGFMGHIWAKHPHYSVMFYKQYWTEALAVCKDSCHIKKIWPYVMADVVVRIYSTLLIFFTVVGVPILTCFGGAYMCTKNEESPLADNFVSTL